MAKFTPTLGGTLHGAMGGVVFQSGRSGHIMRRRSIPRRVSNSSSSRVRVAFGSIAADFRKLDASAMKSWTTWASLYPYDPSGDGPVTAFCQYGQVRTYLAGANCTFPAGGYPNQRLEVAPFDYSIGFGGGEDATLEITLDRALASYEHVLVYATPGLPLHFPTGRLWRFLGEGLLSGIPPRLYMTGQYRAVFGLYLMELSRVFVRLRIIKYRAPLLPDHGFGYGQSGLVEHFEYRSL